MIPLADREYIAELALVRAGLKIDPEKVYLIESRLGPVARREGYAALEELIAAVQARNDERLVWAIVEALALNETSFFRDLAVFESLARDMLPAMAAARGPEPVRVWSAGCGSGQEIHGLAMLVDETPGLVGRVELFASDISEAGLEKAQSGLYTQFEVQRGLPARKLVRHFEKRGELFALSPRIRQATRWLRVNLMDDLTRLGRFDVILCRHVLVGMAPFAQAKVLRSLAAALTPGGRLVLGRNETAGAGFQPASSLPGVFSAAAEQGVRTAA